jgi:hypothetical protein
MEKRTRFYCIQATSIQRQYRPYKIKSSFLRQMESLHGWPASHDWQLSDQWQSGHQNLQMIPFDER